eukprot:symbB.v1.2.002575.t1/scaffold137.1/size303853/6
MRTHKTVDTPTPPLIASATTSTPNPRIPSAPVDPTAPVNGTPQRPVPAPVPYGVPIYGGAQVGVLLNGSLSVPTQAQGNQLFGSMKVPGSPIPGAGSLRGPIGTTPAPVGAMMTGSTRLPVALPGSIRVPSPERQGETLAGSCSCPLWAAPRGSVPAQPVSPPPQSGRPLMARSVSPQNNAPGYAVPAASIPSIPPFMKRRTEAA